MVEIKKQIVPSNKRTAHYGTGNPKKKMVVHQTGNTAKGANAQVHANLQSRGYGASWHVQSDDHEIIQSWPFGYKLWHASTGRRANGGNMVGIGWEICINSDGDYLKSLEIAAEGIAQVMKQEGIPMSGLTTHNAEDTKNHKWCPAQILSGQKGVTWAKFKEMVQKNYNGQANVAAPSAPTPSPSKSVSAIAQEVLNGKWGNNPKRRNDLIAAGYNYDAVQVEVNRLSGVATSKPATTSSKPKANLKEDGYWGREFNKGLQRYFGTIVDGVLSNQSRNSISNVIEKNAVNFNSRKGSDVVRAIQRFLGIKEDGLLGPATITAMQKHAGTVVDGKLSYPSLMVEEWQRRLNAGKLQT